MQTIRRQDRRVTLGEADPSLTPRAGLHLVSELERVLSITTSLDAAIGETRARRRGLSAGELVVSMAETMLAGGDFMADLDHQRKDAAGRPLRAVSGVAASPTFIGRTTSFSDAVFTGIEEANAELVRRWFALLSKERRDALVAIRPSIDLDPNRRRDFCRYRHNETYGPKKEGMAFNHAGQRTGRPHPAIWAEAGLVLAADLGSGTSDPRPQAPALITRAVGALPSGLLRPIVRCDSGFFDKDVARAALSKGCDFAICAKRNPAVWRACREIPEESWREAKDMAAVGRPLRPGAARLLVAMHCTLDMHLDDDLETESD